MTNHHVDTLIVAPRNDMHSRSVQREVRSLGHSCLILNSKSYPAEISLTFSTDGHTRSVQFAVNDGDTRWTIDGETGVWWRRPKHPSMGGVFRHPKVLAFAHAENSLAFHGSLAHCCRTFVNPLTAQYPTTKIYELKVAADLKLRIPETLVTTNPSEAARFVSKPGRRYIHKVLKGGFVGPCTTRLFEDADFAELERIQRCPVMLQEFIPAVADLRVTVVGERLFCAATRIEGDSPIDGRFNKTRPFAYELLPSVGRTLVNLTHALGLVYGAIDLRLTESGEVVFLEINPDGQYLWVELGAGLPITAAMARLLLSDVHVQPTAAEETSDKTVRSWELFGQNA